jgi:hypothetical protein
MLDRTAHESSRSDPLFQRTIHTAKFNVETTGHNHAHEKTGCGSVAVYHSTRTINISRKETTTWDQYMVNTIAMDTKYGVTVSPFTRRAITSRIQVNLPCAKRTACR